MFLIPSLEVGDLFMDALAMMQGDTATVVAGTEQLMHAVREIVSSPWSYVFTLLLALSIRLSAGVSAASAADALGIGGWASGTLCASALLSIDRIQVEHVTRWDAMSTWLDANSMVSQSMGMVITLAVSGARHLWVRRPPSIRAQRPAG